MRIRSKPFAHAANSARLPEIEGADHINVLANPAGIGAMRALLQRESAKTSRFDKASWRNVHETH